MMQRKYLFDVTHSLCVVGVGRGHHLKLKSFWGDLHDLISQHNNARESRDNLQGLFEIRRLHRPGLINSLTAELCTIHYTAPVLFIVGIKWLKTKLIYHVKLSTRSVN